MWGETQWNSWWGARTQHRVKDEMIVESLELLNDKFNFM